MDEDQDIGERAFHALLQFVSDVAGYQTLDDQIRSLSRHLKELTPFEQLAIILHDPATGMMRLTLQEGLGLTGIDREIPFPVDRIPVDYGPSGWVWQSQQSADYSLVQDQTHPTLQYLQRTGIDRRLTLQSPGRRQ